MYKKKIVNPFYTRITNYNLLRGSNFKFDAKQYLRRICANIDCVKWPIDGMRICLKRK